jgi:hypothetical protein
MCGRLYPTAMRPLTLISCLCLIQIVLGLMIFLMCPTQDTKSGKICWRTLGAVQTLACCASCAVMIGAVARR